MKTTRTNSCLTWHLPERLISGSGRCRVLLLEERVRQELREGVELQALTCHQFTPHGLVDHVHQVGVLRREPVADHPEALTDEPLGLRHVPRLVEALHQADQPGELAGVVLNRQFSEPVLFRLILSAFDALPVGLILG